MIDKKLIQKSITSDYKYQLSLMTGTVFLTQYHSWGCVAISISIYTLNSSLMSKLLLDLLSFEWSITLDLHLLDLVEFTTTSHVISYLIHHVTLRHSFQTNLDYYVIYLYKQSHDLTSYPVDSTIVTSQVLLLHGLCTTQHSINTKAIRAF